MTQAAASQTLHVTPAVTPNTSWYGAALLGGSAEQIAVGQNQSGGLEIFFTGTSNGLWHNRQTSVGGSWAGPSPFPGDSAKEVAVALNNDGTLQLFYVGMNNYLYTNRQTEPNGSTWAGESNLMDLTEIQTLAVGQNLDGHLELFYASGDVLYHIWQTAPSSNTWAGPLDIPSYSNQVCQAKKIAIARNRNGGLQVFFIEPAYNGLNQAWRDVESGVWMQSFLGEAAAQEIAVGLNADGQLELFYVGTNNDLYHMRQVGAGSTDWLDETSFPGVKAKQIAAARNKSGALEIFFTGMNNGLWHNWQLGPSNSGWAGATPFTGEQAQNVAVGQNHDGRLEIFFPGEGNRLYHDWQITPA